MSVAEMEVRVDSPDKIRLTRTALIILESISSEAINCKTGAVGYLAEINGLATQKVHDALAELVEYELVEASSPILARATHLAITPHGRKRLGPRRGQPYAPSPVLSKKPRKPSHRRRPSRVRVPSPGSASRDENAATPAEYATMAVLAQLPKASRGFTHQELMQQLGLNQMLVTARVAKLKKRGWLIAQHPGGTGVDQRCRVYSLTDEGVAAYSADTRSTEPTE